MSFKKKFLAAVLLLLLSVVIPAYCASLPSGSQTEKLQSEEGETPKKIGSLRVKLGASQILAGANEVSNTHGDVDINGFNAHLKFHTVKVEAKRAAGISAQKRVKMPFTNQLADISNRAAAASAQPPAAAFPCSHGTAPCEAAQHMTPEDRRERVRRIIGSLLPAIRRRVMLFRMRQQQEPQEAESRGEAEGVPAKEEPVAGEDPRQAEIEALRQENERLRRMVKALSLAVRGLLRYTIKLNRKLAERRQQEANNESPSEETAPEEDEDESKIPQSPLSSPPEAPSMETPHQLKARQSILMRQYPPVRVSIAP